MKGGCCKWRYIINISREPLAVRVHKELVSFMEVNVTVVSNFHFSGACFRQKDTDPLLNHLFTKTCLLRLDKNALIIKKP